MSVNKNVITSSMPFFRGLCKALCLGLFLCGCSTNVATGERQFTALMSESSEVQIGAAEHEKIIQKFGVVEDKKLQDYVDQIGQKLAANTERENVTYRFTVLDSPIVNAFALPGGYVYVSRGLMALANSEAELASVIGHEIAHVTARHSAQQYSKAVLASLGLSAISIAVDTPGLDDVASVGTDLYLKAYSRKHEHQADELGIRYLHLAGYDLDASPSFLESLMRHDMLQQKISGQSAPPFAYFSTHPLTADRIAETKALVAGYPKNETIVNKVDYFAMLEGMVYGESPKNGLIKGQVFVHPELDLYIRFPDGFEIVNLPDRVIAKQNNVSIVFDGARKQAGQPIEDYLRYNWAVAAADAPNLIYVNGMPAATNLYRKNVSGSERIIRRVAIAHSDTQIYRFTITMPSFIDPDLTDEVKRTTYSFRKFQQADRLKYQPQKIKVFAASKKSNIAKIAKAMPFEDYQEARFRSLNGLGSEETLIPNRLYKKIIE